ncbi:nucleotidyltransferase family protein [Dyadobacter fermentans]|uniref:Putative nucleoside-diphosphate-sugar pyrophosphorylase n=1 Tax=Dyadobacter fermentans (strain ATCC 700827 / DSM 18053 / CIP 107007 / KCTC 52180 / NS114) TaxID=471854 RepID=C6W1P1_DYAFD|nr:sugar phosphate nucleotidyltransferase [Dyadobacter fermentans]ACT93771.1 putative nucleoside-diphosphate-sugar pyrophosphorylase [Dyadobacter fermentans DSM 18053]
MNYAIIAAGEGSRLAKEGFTLPKPMVSLHGEMLIDRLIGIFMRNNATKIMVIVNEESPLLEMHLMGLAENLPIQIVRKSTPSSLHSVYELFKGDPELSEVCLTTTDTVFREEEFSAFISEFEENTTLEGQMAVTAFIDDESPLYVAVDDDDRITAFTDDNSTDTPFVSGGIYCLRRKAIETVNAAVENGVSRMRNFQRQLVADGLHLKAYPFTKIVDVDHVSDIQTAELFLSGEAVY